MVTQEFFPLYSRLWLSSKYAPPDEILRLIRNSKSVWLNDAWLSRLVGALYPVFSNTESAAGHRELALQSDAAFKAYSFMEDLRNEEKAFNEAYNYLKAENPTKGTRISHSRYLMLVSALGNTKADPKKINKLVSTHGYVWADVFYLRLARRSSKLNSFTPKPLPRYPVP